MSTHSYPSDGYCSETNDTECFTKKLLATRDIAQVAHAATAAATATATATATAAAAAAAAATAATAAMSVW